MKEPSQIKVFLERQIELRKSECDDLAKKFNDNPAYALEWSSSTFTAAARWEIYSRVLGALFDENSEATLDSVIEWFEREIRVKASYPESSTSMPSNLMNRCRLAAMTELVETLKKFA